MAHVLENLEGRGATYDARPITVGVGVDRPRAKNPALEALDSAMMMPEKPGSVISQNVRRAAFLLGIAGVFGGVAGAALDSARAAVNQEHAQDSVLIEKSLAGLDTSARRKLLAFARTNGIVINAKNILALTKGELPFPRPETNLGNDVLASIAPAVFGEPQQRAEKYDVMSQQLAVVLGGSAQYAEAE